MSDAAHRNSVSGMSFRSSGELISYCRGIDAGWYRCQAIAMGAPKLGETESRVALQHAINAAESESDAFRKLTPQVWVVEAMILSDDVRSAKRLAEKLIDSSGTIKPSNSEACMLELLFERCRSNYPELGQRIFRKLMAILELKGGWRVERACMHTAETLDALGHSDFVDECLSRCTNRWLIGRVRRNRGAQQDE